MASPPRLDAYHFYEREWADYGELAEAFEWEIPDRFNIATYVCDRWADEEDRVAIFAEAADGTRRTYTFREVRDATNRLANLLRERGIERGDRVAVNTPQAPETVFAHVAIWKLGAVSVPLSTLFGPDAIEYRLTDCDVKAIVVDESNVDALRAIKDECPSLGTTLTVGDVEREDDELDLYAAIDGHAEHFEPVETGAEENAIILYTSGTTGEPKGVVHAHRILLGFLPTIVTTVGNGDIRRDDVFWSPSEWAWIGTLFLVVFPPMFYGNPTIAYENGPFEPEKAFELIDRYGVTNFFAPPTALRMMMQVDDPGAEYDLASVRAITSGGETLGESIVDWADGVFSGAAVNDWYGQTEADPIVTSCAALMEFRKGMIGKASLGVEVELLDPDSGEPSVEPGELGEIAVDYESSRPVCFKEYWNKPEKTAEKVRDGWLLTEDLGTRDEDGYYAFHSRKDDVILSAGYKIGPEEVEECLARHEAVVDAGVVGVPNEVRGEVPKAYVVLVDGAEPSEELGVELQQFVKDQLADYQYPRAVEFIDELPTTATGKVQRYVLEERDAADADQ